MRNPLLDLTAANPRLRELEGTCRPVKLAINIHSFSECTADASHWWVERLATHKVPNLLIITNAHDSRTGECLTNGDENMDRIFEQHGYVLRVREPRFSDLVVLQFGGVPTWLHLLAFQPGGARR